MSEKIQISLQSDKKRLTYIFITSQSVLLRTRNISGKYVEKITTISFITCVGPSVCPSTTNNSVPTGRILVKFDT